MVRDQVAINVILIRHQSRTVALYPSRKEPKRDGETARYRSDCVRLSSNTASYVNFRPATFTVRSIGRASTTAFPPDDSSVDVSGRTRTPTRTWQEASCVVVIVMAAGRNYLFWVVCCGKRTARRHFANRRDGPDPPETAHARILFRYSCYPL